MQTFMTAASYYDTASKLDDKRLGKQRVEAFQIIKALRGDYNDTGAWVNHPATRMWAGNIYQLACYGYAICEEWIGRGFDDSLIDEFNNEIHNKRVTKHPWWVNSELLHLTHQSNLMRKASDLYDFNVPDNIPYVWPLMDEQAFRLGTYKKGDNLTMLGNNIVYLTSKQVAELLGVSPKTISSYKARGQMPAPDREYGRTPLWKYSTIQEWRKELRTPIKTEK